ncbi:MAG: helix-turn-helix domain-containing protein [Planctomycetes bacterium]|nr:helix-turn-helix domain-containing protein [Planctomycetota bacterium]
MLHYIKLTKKQIKELDDFLKIKRLPLAPDEKRIRTRGQAVCYSAEGWPVSDIAKKLNTYERSVWRWLEP